MMRLDPLWLHQDIDGGRIADVQIAQKPGGDFQIRVQLGCDSRHHSRIAMLLGKIKAGNY